MNYTLIYGSNFFFFYFIVISYLECLKHYNKWIYYLYILNYMYVELAAENFIILYVLQCFYCMMNYYINFL